MAEVPFVTFHALVDQPDKVFVHLRDKVRTFTETNAERIRNVLTNVLIAEFGLQQQHAEIVTKDALDARDAKAADADHAKLLQEQLADNDTQLTAMLQAKLKAESDLSLARSDLATANKRIADLEKQLAAATPPAPEPSAPIPVPEPTASLMPVGETQPHDPNGPNVPGTAAASVLASTDPHNPPANGGVVSTPAGETPPAETSAPQTNAAAAPIPVAVGGDHNG
jgi:hypothetical protein